MSRVHFRHRSIYPNNDNKKKKTNTTVCKQGTKRVARAVLYLLRGAAAETVIAVTVRTPCVARRAVEYIFTRTTRTTAAVRVSLRDNSRIFFVFFFSVCFWQLYERTIVARWKSNNNNIIRLECAANRIPLVRVCGNFNTTLVFVVLFGRSWNIQTPIL